MTNSEATAIVDQAIHLLREHFDDVQVLVTWTAEDGHTKDLFCGSGNWYARQGMAHEFLECDKAEVQSNTLIEKQRGEES